MSGAKRGINVEEIDRGERFVEETVVVLKKSIKNLDARKVRLVVRIEKPERIVIKSKDEFIVESLEALIMLVNTAKST